LEPTRHRTYRTANNYLLRQGFERRVETGTWVHRGKRLRATQHWRGLRPYLVEITYEPLDQKGKGAKAPSADAVAERTHQ
jgi:hypothetical protein